MCYGLVLISAAFLYMFRHKQWKRRLDVIRIGSFADPLTEKEGSNLLSFFLGAKIPPLSSETGGGGGGGDGEVS